MVSNARWWKVVLVAGLAVVPLVGCGSDEGEAAAAGTDTAAQDASDGSGGGDGTSGADTGSADTGSADSGSADTASGTDASTADAGAEDTASADADTDTATTDTGTTDAGSTDTGGTDTGPACVPTTPPDEVCDGKDNDCDGETDEGGDTPCDDGDACTEGELCQDGSCGNGSAKTCDDGDECTTDACNKDKGCTATALESGACDDGDACTENDACSKDKGCVGTDMSCDDGDVCTDDLCVPGQGCKANPAKCDDDSACTLDSCDKAKGGCQHEVVAGCTACKDGDAKTCDDGDECTKEVCLSGKCVFPQPQGCVPKANFSVKNMTVSPATGTAGTKLQVKVQMNNYGAKVPNVSQQVMFEIVVAQGESLAQGTTAGIYGAQMSSDLGAPNPTGTFATINFTAGNPPGGDKAYDRICARIIYPDDSWPADNVTCTKFTWTPAAGGGGNPP